jgi:hypothetical protein
MPQIVLLAALGALAYAGFRSLSRAGQKIAADLERAKRAAQQSADAHHKVQGVDGGTLIYDPTSGVYRPRQS